MIYYSAQGAFDVERLKEALSTGTQTQTVSKTVFVEPPAMDALSSRLKQILDSSSRPSVGGEPSPADAKPAAP